MIKELIQEKFGDSFYPNFVSFVKAGTILVVLSIDGKTTVS